MRNRFFLSVLVSAVVLASCVTETGMETDTTTTDAGGSQRPEPAFVFDTHTYESMAIGPIDTTWLVLSSSAHPGVQIMLQRDLVPAQANTSSKPTTTKRTSRTREATRIGSSPLSSISAARRTRSLDTGDSGSEGAMRT
jgi:hypothetical protein